MHVNTARFIESFDYVSPDPTPVVVELETRVRKTLAAKKKPVAKAKAPRVRKRRYLTPIEIAVDDARRRAQTGYWDTAKISSIVGLYGFCHQIVYGVLPVELEEPGTFALANRAARRVAHRVFNDEIEVMAAFVRWSWEREKRINQWAQGKTLDRKPMRWTAQFSLAKATEYKVAMKQKRF